MPEAGAWMAKAAFMSRPRRASRHIVANILVTLELVRTAAGWRFLERRGSLDFRPRE